MLTAKFILKRISLPTDWEPLREGLDEENRKNIKRIYIVFTTPNDVVTIIVYLNLKAENCSVQAGWKIKSAKSRSAGSRLSDLSRLFCL